MEKEWYVSKESLLFLKREDFDILKIPRGLRDLILTELHKEQTLKTGSLSKHMSVLSLKPEIEEEDQLFQLQSMEIQNQSELPNPHEKLPEDKTLAVENLVGLRGFIKECLTFEEALEVINSEGAKNGVCFKRGNSHYYENSKYLKDKRIVCAKMNRNKSKILLKEQGNKKGSLDQIKDFQWMETADCPVYYKFIFTIDGKMTLDKCHETHNHSLTFSGVQLTQEMLNDLKLYNKRTKIIDIKESLEKKYKTILDYHTLYYEFRKIFPRFGDEDAINFIKILKQKKVYYKADLQEGKICKLFFATPRMIRNYELYGDIILIDSTYRVNQYNIPLLVYSGIDAGGRNIIFGLSLINDETEATFSWCLQEFFTLYAKFPTVVVTDQDLALLAVLSKEFPQITHLLCQWHILQNLKKHFSFLQTMNLKMVSDRIIALPFLSEPTEFENELEDLGNILKEKKYLKSAEYLTRISKLKMQWASCYTPMIFTAGIHTTSRIESINAVIKLYVNSNSEISDIIDFIITFEEKLLIKNQLEEEKNSEVHPLLKELRPILSRYIFNLHFEQHTLSYRYLIHANDLSLSNFDNLQPSFRVKSIDAKDPEHFRLVKLVENKYMCECETFIQCGIICRHIFYLSNMRQEKDLSNIRINPRWLIKDDKKTESFKDLFGDCCKSGAEETKDQKENVGNQENNEIPQEKGSYLLIYFFNI